MAGILYIFRLALERRTKKKNTCVIKIRVLTKLLPNNFSLSDAEGNTSKPLNRVGIAYLPLLRTVLAIWQEPWELSFWEVIDYFILLAYASVTALRIIQQQLLACLNFALDSEGLICL